MTRVHIKPKALAYAQKLDKKLRNATNKRIDDLEQDFSQHSDLLTAPLKGLRSTDVKKDYRIIFAVCEECRNNGWEELNRPRCECCGTLPLNAIHIVKIGHRKNVYNIKRDVKLKGGKKRKK